jgi:hypothetical protein
VDVRRNDYVYICVHSDVLLTCKEINAFFLIAFVVYSVFSVVYYVSSVVYSVFYVVYSVLCCVFCILYCSVTSYRFVLLFFFCVLYRSLFSYCTVSACDVRAATLTEGFPCFFLCCKANARV